MNRKLTKTDIIFMGCIFIAMIAVVNTPKAIYIPKPVVSIEEQSKLDYDNWVYSLFSSFDGSYSLLVEGVKNQLLDPESFKHLKTTYLRMTNKVIISMNYSATNAYGGRVIKSITIEVFYKTKES